MKTNSGGELQMSKKTEESNFLFCGNQECPNLMKKKKQSQPMAKKCEN